jgi:hypothetical protein
LRRASRRILARRVIENAGLGVVVGGLAASSSQIVLWLAGTPHRTAGIIILLVALLGAAVAALMKGVSLRQAARYIDSRAALDERLTTAVELAAVADSSPAARCVYAQASQAAGSVEAARINLWVRGRVTAGAAVLAVLLCGATTMLPQSRSADERILDALAQMSPEAVKALAEEFARAAQTAEADAPLLARAARAVKRKDARALAAILDDLRRRGVKLVRIVSPEVLAVATAGGSDGHGASATRPASPESVRIAGHAGGAVHVWDPLYDKLGLPHRSTTRTAVVDNPPTAVRYRDAWYAARLRAAGALRGGGIPPEHRRMVREFFSDHR